MSTPRDTLEPGLLRVFRLTLLGLWLLLTVVLVLEGIRSPRVPDYLEIFGWVQTTLLLGYLSWHALQQRLQAAYLPISLWVSAVGPVVFQAMGTYLHIRQGVHGAAALIDPNSLYLWLLMPLLLISVQYDLRALFGFTIGTAALTIVLTVLLVRSGGFTLHSTLVSAGQRLVIFSIAGAVIVVLSAAQRRHRADLTQRQEALTRYALTVEQLTVSRERNRLARDVHDTLAHTLSAISVQLGALDVLWDSDPVAAHALLHQTTELTRAGLDEARVALHDLRARPVEAVGLVLALRQLAEQSAEHANWDLTLALPAALGGGTAEVEQQLYRIAAEALTNVTRHAQAQGVTVTLCQENQQIQLTITDDGVGFVMDATPAAGHYGLTGMRERALLLGADLTVTSAPSMGTTVTVVTRW